MSCPTLEEFRARFTEFSTVPDDKVNTFITEGCDALSESILGDCFWRAALYYIAHILAVSIRTTNLTEQAGYIAPSEKAGMIVSSAADGVSVSYQASNTKLSQSGAWYSTTPYGRQFLVIADECGSIGKVFRGRDSY